MNKNKGFIGIGLILAIVLGVAVVGGGAYYLGKSGNKQEVKSPENVLLDSQNQNIQPIKQNQNLPVVENTKVVTSSIKVLSIRITEKRGFLI